MPTMEKIDNTVHLSMFKGEPGTRKSTQALTYPKPQYWFSWDWKMNAMMLPIQHYGINRRDIEFDDYKSYPPMEKKLYDFFVNCRYKTIVVDSITSIGDRVLLSTLDAKTGTTRQDGGKAGRKIAGIDVNELEDYNAETSALRDMVSTLQELKNLHHIDIILIAHVIRTESTDLKGITKVSRQIVTAGKKVAVKIPAYCDETYHFGIEGGFEVGKGGQYTIITSNTGDDYARTSLPLPLEIKIGNDNLYDKYIKPAIDSLHKKETEITRI